MVATTTVAFLWASWGSCHSIVPPQRWRRSAVDVDKNHDYGSILTATEWESLTSTQDDMPGSANKIGVGVAITSFLGTAFLPCPPDTSLTGASRRFGSYKKFLVYDNLQDICTAIRKYIVDLHIFEGLGVGRASATALVATMSFALRDFFGICSSLAFSAVVSRNLARHVKQWKFFSALMLDLGLAMKVTANLKRQWFLPLLCGGSICEAMYGVTTSPCTSIINLHWANTVLGSEDGIAEIISKRRAQRTLNELVGGRTDGLGD